MVDVIAPAQGMTTGLLANFETSWRIETMQCGLRSST